MDSFYRCDVPGHYVPGTIVGPNSFGELLVIRNNGFINMAWTATKDDILKARSRAPQAMTEFNLLKLRVKSEIFGL